MSCHKSSKRNKNYSAAVIFRRSSIDVVYILQMNIDAAVITKIIRD